MSASGLPLPYEARRAGEVPAYVAIGLHVHDAGHDRTLVSAVTFPLREISVCELSVLGHYKTEY